jgi:cobalamin biosynthesis Mg chelatase CobN
LPLHAASIKRAVLISFLLCSASSWASDIQCESTRQPAQRVICDHAILNHEYDNIYEQQQKLLQTGKLTTAALAAWQHQRDACIDVHCIDVVFAQWSSVEKNPGNGPAAPVATISEALGLTASQALGVTASEALGSPPASPATSAASLAAAEASQQASSVPVARQGSAYGIALPQPVASAASAPAPVSEASAATGNSGTSGNAGSGSSNPLFVALGVLLLIAACGVGAIVMSQRKRRG